MNQLITQIEQHKTEIASCLVKNKEELESFRIKYLGTKGLLKSIMGEMKNVSVEQKKRRRPIIK